jgi:sulfotransferase family protein
MAPIPRWMQQLEPPDCPAGWRTGPPDFVGVGAQRCGTSWWYRGTIRSHPDVVRVAKPGKELHYFDRFWSGDVPADYVDRYRALFPRPERAITGEWTPRYMVDFWTMRLLRGAAPDARLLIMLRDPIERLRSGIQRERMLADDAGAPFELAHMSEAVYRGLYYDQVVGVLELYPRERVLILQFERCRSDPIGEMRRTQEFLGLEPLTEMPEKLAQHKRPPGTKPELSEERRDELVRRFRDDVARLAGLCPEIDLELWPNFADVEPVAQPTIAGASAG